MPEDLLPDDPPPPPVRVPTEAEDRARAVAIGLMTPAGEGPMTVTCGFCDCELTRTRGEVIKRSKKALDYLDTELVIRELRRDLAATQKRAELAQQEIEKLKGVAPAGNRW